MATEESHRRKEVRTVLAEDPSPMSIQSIGVLIHRQRLPHINQWATLQNTVNRKPAEQAIGKRKPIGAGSATVVEFYRDHWSVVGNVKGISRKVRKQGGCI